MIVSMFVFFVILPFKKGAPWLPTGMKKVRKMLALAEIQPYEVLYDLGCGDGRFVINAARKYGAKAVGIEINLFLYLWCQLLVTVLGLRRRVKIKYGSFLKRDLSDADVIMCYLLPHMNNKLEDKLLRELKPTARIVSNSFLFNKFPIASESTPKGIYLYNVGIKN